MAAIVLGVVVSFARFNEPFRHMEVRLATGLLRLVFPHLDADVLRTSVVIQPHRGPFIAAVLLPSCSALASLLAVGCLGLVTPRRAAGRWRRRGALAAALTVVGVGNLLRITGSLAVGVVAGRRALILFHDVAGSIFTFVTIMGGYTLFLFLLLPRAEEPMSDAGVLEHAGA